MSPMPMFPLGMVLYPGSVLPLHVFEPRYRKMVDDCVADPEHEFGVVLIERGQEVGGGEMRMMTGTVARMLQVAQLPDGRFALVTVGTRRIRVNSWLPDDPYPLADTDDWPEEGADDEDALAMARGLAVRVRQAAALALELGDPVPEIDTELADDPVLASYQLCALAPVSVMDRQDLLCAPGPLARLQLLEERLGDVEAVLRFRLDDR